jgi:Gram-negative bacterial TonB protein C-terminal
MALSRACLVAWVAAVMALGGCRKKEWVTVVKTTERLADAGNPAWALMPRVGGSTDDVIPPRLLSRIELVIPERCRESSIEGPFIFEAIVTETGAVENVHVVKAPVISPPCSELEAESLRSLSQSKYEPTKIDGRPVRVVLTITESVSIQ